MSKGHEIRPALRRRTQWTARASASVAKDGPRFGVGRNILAEEWV